MKKTRLWVLAATLTICGMTMVSTALPNHHFGQIQRTDGVYVLNTHNIIDMKRNTLLLIMAAIVCLLSCKTKSMSSWQENLRQRLSEKINSVK